LEESCNTTGKMPVPLRFAEVSFKGSLPLSNQQKWWSLSRCDKLCLRRRHLVAWQCLDARNNPAAFDFPTSKCLLRRQTRSQRDGVHHEKAKRATIAGRPFFEF